LNLAIEKSSALYSQSKRFLNETRAVNDPILVFLAKKFIRAVLKGLYAILVNFVKVFALVINKALELIESTVRQILRFLTYAFPNEKSIRKKLENERKKEG